MVNAVKKVQKRYVLHTRIRCKKNMRIELEAAVRLQGIALRRCFAENYFGNQVGVPGLVWALLHNIGVYAN